MDHLASWINLNLRGIQLFEFKRYIINVSSMKKFNTERLWAFENF